MMLELDVMTIIAVEGEPIHITGGQSKEKAIELLERAVELIKANKVEHETTEEE